MSQQPETDQDQTKENTVIIPFRDLDPNTLKHLLQEFVTRDGCDWDERGCSLEEKVEQVMQQLYSGRAQIIFDLNSETTNLVASS